jgi:hypothetical protein
MESSLSSTMSRDIVERGTNYRSQLVEEVAEHGLRTPNEGINLRRQIGSMWQTKYASAVPKHLGVGVNFRTCSEGYFLS